MIILIMPRRRCAWGRWITWMKPINKKVIVERLTGMMHTIDQERQKRRDDLLVKERWRR